MQFKQYFDLSKPLNPNQFAYIFVGFFIATWLLRSSVSLSGVITSFTGLWLISTPSIYLLTIAYTKRIKDIGIQYSLKKVCTMLTIWFILGACIHFIFLGKSQVFLESLRNGTANLPLTIADPFMTWAIYSGIINLPIAVLSFYLLFKKSKLQKVS